MKIDSSPLPDWCWWIKMASITKIDKVLLISLLTLQTTSATADFNFKGHHYAIVGGQTPEKRLSSFYKAVEMTIPIRDAVGDLDFATIGRNS